ncbi:MAG: putative rane protein [Rickettsiaceae bacterium]|nr:putative rane protein [Rickettsiaceae bacterium]
MLSYLSNYYDWFKTIHVIAVISWMAGMLYLPRLYVYHADVKYGSESDKLLQIMEYRLLKYIVNPAMIVTFIFGLTNAYIYGFKALGTWFHIKMTAVLVIATIHGFLARWRKDFTKGINKHSANFYRVINETITVCMVIAVATVIIKPFD